MLNYNREVLVLQAFEPKVLDSYARDELVLKVKELFRFGDVSFYSVSKKSSLKVGKGLWSVALILYIYIVESVSGLFLLCIGQKVGLKAY
jgi:hypothetical protein